MSNGNHQANRREDIAIIGMACLFPGAPDLQSFWRNIVSGTDATSDPPPEAWDDSVFYDPDGTANDRVYCKRGGFLGPLAAFDPLAHGVMPSALHGSEPDQWLALAVARAAFVDAGYRDEIPERHRTAVILGKGTYLNRGNLTAAQHGQVVDQTLQLLQQLRPDYDAAALRSLRAELKRALPPFNADTAPGLIPNVTVGRIANRLDLMGPSYTVDAACASSLIAVDLARRDLATGRCDLALVGGVHVVTPVPVLMLFCQLGALSRRQQIRPFDAQADGTLLSEGLGMAVLKRRADAERDGDRIYAVIAGTGVASDGRALSVLAPRVEGEEQALREAYHQSGIAPGSVGLIEAHGTATLVGDATEVEALRRVWGPRTGALPRTALGTVKSMIGHTMPAAGMAGLIKAALSLYHRTLPPTLGVEQPSPKLELEQTPFYLNSATRPWIHGAVSTPRRAGVNAFGFGGINAHVILEEAPHDSAGVSGGLAVWNSELFVLRGATRDELSENGRRLQQRLSTPDDWTLAELAAAANSQQHADDAATHGACLALVAASREELAAKLASALARLEDPSCRKIKDRGGIYYFAEPLGRTGKLAFLFPGEGAQYVDMLLDVCLAFPLVRGCFDEMDRAFAGEARGYPLSACVFPPPRFGPEQQAAAEQRLWQMDVAIEALVTANHALYRLLSSFGIRPDALLGHSTGEFSALRAAGMLDTATSAERLSELNRRYEQVASAGGVPRAGLLALGTGREQAEALAQAAGGELHVAMDNCPHQVVLVGSDAAVEQAAALASARGVVAQVLPFDRPYHTPLYAPYAAVVGDVLEHWIVKPPEVPVYSCTSAARFPEQLSGARALASQHWVQPVEFRRTIEAMYADGVRMFVEVGPRGNLTSFVDDTLRGRAALAVPVDVAHRSGITQLQHVLGLLAAHGVPLQLEPLYAGRALRDAAVEGAPDTHAKARPNSRVTLATGWPPMSISDDVAARMRAQTVPLAPAMPDTSVAYSNGNGYAPTVSNGNGHAPADSNGNGYIQAAPGGNGYAPAANGAQDAATGYGNGAVPVLPQESAAPPAAPLSYAVAGDDAATTQVMGAYFETMQQFLAVQSEVMQAYLGSGRPAAPPAVHPYRDVEAAPAPEVPTALPVRPEQPLLPLPSAPAPPIADLPPPEHEVSHPATAAQLPATADIAAASPAAGTLDRATLGRLLIDIVSEKTGYPPDMLDPELDMEADLGIDSIKRVEILGAVQQQTGMQLADRMDALSAQRTLAGVVEALAGQEAPGAPSRAPPAGDSNAHEPAAEPHVAARQPGRELVRFRVIDLGSYPALRDHTLGRYTRQSDGSLAGLPLVPLTLTMELMAQTAAELMPGATLVGMRNVRSYRWAALDDGALSIEIRARPSGVAGEVYTAIFDRASADTAQRPLADGTMLFDAGYEQAPVAAAFPLDGECPPALAPDRLYRDAMFHGPAFQGVRKLERMGADGCQAQLVALPLDGLGEPHAAPELLTDPLLLDQPGQVLGFWAAQLLERANLVFPFHLAALELFGPPPPAGTLLECRVRVVGLDAQQVRSDLEIVDRDARLWARLSGWEDRRFDVPDRLRQLLLAPAEAVLSDTWQPPGDTAGLRARRLNVGDFGAGLLDRHGAIWRRVLAHTVLAQRELEAWHGLGASEQRRVEWLLGRIAAKDVVRELLREHGERAPAYAEIEILPDAHGRPLVAGGWVGSAPPAVTIAHCEGEVVAVGTARAAGGLGVDIERPERLTDDVAGLAFGPGEQAVFAGLPHGELRALQLRCWCAKEAAAKALGKGMLHGPRALAVHAFDAERGVVYLELPRTEHSPGAEPTIMAVDTAEAGDYTVATALYRENANEQQP